jgi:hypothetical protein
VTQRKRSAIERRLIEGFVRRAADTQAPLLAAPLRRYAIREGLSWEELARSLGGTTEGLDQVALCHPPRSERFVEDVAAIAAGSVEADRLLLVLRRIQVLGSFTGFPAASMARPSDVASGLLLAARDRGEAEREAREDGEGEDAGTGEAGGPAGEPEPADE